MSRFGWAWRYSGLWLQPGGGGGGGGDGSCIKMVVFYLHWLGLTTSQLYIPLLFVIRR